MFDQQKKNKTKKNVMPSDYKILYLKTFFYTLLYKTGLSPQ